MATTNEKQIIKELAEDIHVNYAKAEEIFNKGYRKIAEERKCDCCGKTYFSIGFNKGIYSITCRNKKHELGSTIIALCQECYHDLLHRRNNADIEFFNKCKFFEG